MTETPDKSPSLPPTAQTTSVPVTDLKPVSRFKLSMGRPRLHVRTSRKLAWLAFIFLALLPLCVAASIVLYLTSSRWPADFSDRLSRATGLQVSVGSVTVLAQNTMQLHDINIAPRGDLPVLLYAKSGTYEVGQAPTLVLTDVELNLDLDWWSDPKSIPDAGLFFPDASHPRTPVLALQDLNIRLRTAGHTHVVHAADAIALLANGMVKLTTKLSRDATAKPEASTEQIAIRIGYQQGAFVRRLTITQAPTDLLREYLTRALGSEWTSAFSEISGDLVLRHPSEGTNWEFNGRGVFDPSLLEESSGLHTLGGQYEVKFRNVSAYDDKVLQGVFDISLIRNPYKVPVCSSEALRGLQFLATGTEPALASNIGNLPFDRASVVLTVNGTRIYIHTAEKDDAMISSGGVPIISFPPQELTHQEWSHRLEVLKTLWAKFRVS